MVEAYPLALLVALAAVKTALRTDRDTWAAIRVLHHAVRRREAEAAAWMLGILTGGAELS